jgi:hypothetical protein
MIAMTAGLKKPVIGSRSGGLTTRTPTRKKADELKAFCRNGINLLKDGADSSVEKGLSKWKRRRSTWS